MHKIKKVLNTQYGLDRITVSGQQGGWTALAYKVTSSGRTYFLKVYEKSRASTPKWTSLIDKYVPIIVWLTHNTGLQGKIPVPLLTKNGDYQCEDDDGIYLLYEYIDGETIGNQTLTDTQICQLAEIISELHSYGKEIPVDTDAIKEDFNVPFAKQLRSILNKEYSRLPSDVWERIEPHTKSIGHLIDTVNRLSEYLRNSDLRMTLCHTDIHNWNLMQSDQQLMLIDWEGLKLAPVEADLMFLVDKPYYAEFLSIYRKTHKDFVINQDALLFYQIRRKLEDIWELIEQLLFDNQDAHGRAETINFLTRELEDICE